MAGLHLGALWPAGARRTRCRSINRGLYLSELTLRPTAAFAELQSDLKSLAGPLFNELPALLERRAAAE
jgi:hypothetical protein